MQKTIFMMSCLSLCFLININAQVFDITAPKTFIALDVKGDVQIKGNTDNPMLSSGMVLTEKQVLTLEDGASATLAVGGQMMTLNEAGTYKLKKEVKKLDGKSDDSFLARINTVSGFNKKGKKDTGTQDGWGDKSAINPIMPIGGDVPLENTTSFTWDGASESGFKFTLMEPVTGETIITALTKSNSFTLDVNQLTIEKGKEFHWMVSNAKKESKKSAINFVSPNKITTVMDDLQATDAYKNSADWLKPLREADALASNNMISKAYDVYMKTLKMFPDNELVKDAAANFLAKNGLGGMWKKMSN